ncbi:hypothetical protein E9232_001759 [Inquilinus ginsengisoli]|uniref:Uncharacterized protein n=1 Tax=Inquilinus ginsengisoli TaxID=363840 RepID=A0ABU1JMH8_9PROT|nr:hypothetical protein [Inquilinus ginsengisoli]MDR6289244.1 hypothetical protein [Inquilinus ginsengisoli]
MAIQTRPHRGFAWTREPLLRSSCLAGQVVIAAEKPMSSNPHDPKQEATSALPGPLIDTAQADASPRWLLPAVIALMFLTGALVSVAIAAV